MAVLWPPMCEMTRIMYSVTANGIEAVEAKMTSRYVENLKRYQEAGYFTDIVVD